MTVAFFYPRLVATGSSGSRDWNVRGGCGQSILNTKSTAVAHAGSVLNLKEYHAYLHRHVMRILARRLCTRVPVPADPELPWRSRRVQASPIARYGGI